MTQRPERSGAQDQSISASRREKENKVKEIKMIGLTGLTALLAMAFVGASSAMAESTALCSVDENPCNFFNQVRSIHETSVGKAKLLTNIGTVECNVLFSSTITTGLTNPFGITGNFTYTNCTFAGSSCTVTEENGSENEIRVLKEGHETAKVTGEELLHVVCGSSIICNFNGTGLVGIAKGPLLSTLSNGEVVLSAQGMPKESGFLCPKITTLDIVTSPLSATYITN
jgi:hypothetical protein